MFNIASYLDKFKNIGQGEKLLKEAIIEAVREATGVEIEAKAINMRNGEAQLKVSPAIKSVIYIKKEAVLAKIKEKTEQRVLEIR